MFLSKYVSIYTMNQLTANDFKHIKRYVDQDSLEAIFSSPFHHGSPGLTAVIP